MPNIFSTLHHLPDPTECVVSVASGGWPLTEERSTEAQKTNIAKKRLKYVYLHTFHFSALLVQEITSIVNGFCYGDAFFWDIAGAGTLFLQICINFRYEDIPPMAMHAYNAQLVGTMTWKI